MSIEPYTSGGNEVSICDVVATVTTGATPESHVTCSSPTTAVAAAAADHVAVQW